MDNLREREREHYFASIYAKNPLIHETLNERSTVAEIGINAVVNATL